MPLTLPIYLRGRTYVLHFRVRGRQIKRTLNTADPHIAKLRALQLLQVVHMAIKGDNPNLSDFNIDPADVRKYKLNLQTGQMETDGMPEDHQNLMDAIDRIGIIPGRWPKTPQSAATGIPAVPATIPKVTPSIRCAYSVRSKIAFKLFSMMPRCTLSVWTAAVR